MTNRSKKRVVSDGCYRLLALVSLLGLSAAACARQEAVEPGPQVVVEVAGAPVLLSDLEQYFRVNLLDEPGEEPPEPADVNRVKSRLLDALVDEWILLAEAERRGIDVDAAEVDAYLDQVRDDVEARRPTSGSERLMVRRRLIIERLQQRLAGELPPPTDEEIRSYVEQNRERLGSSRRVILRALMVESEETANRLRQDIRKGRATFADVARQHEIQPGQAAPMTVAWTSLSEPIRRALSGLNPGQVTSPLHFQGQTYLFQLQGWLDEVEPTGEELIRGARAELAWQERRRANDALLADLREKGAVRLLTQNLPFRYVPDAVRRNSTATVP